MGYVGAVAEGADRVLAGRSPNHVYVVKGTEFPIIPRNYRLSDDVGFRFANPQWKEFPLTAEITGIFEFLKALPYKLMERGIDFMTVSEAVHNYQPVGELNYDPPITWADMDRDLSAWLNNELQWAAFEKIKALKPIVMATRDPHIVKIWRKLQTSDHFYYMSLKYNQDGDIHAYFRNEAFESPYDAYISYMNTLAHFEGYIKKSYSKQNRESTKEPKNIRKRASSS